MTYRLLSKYRAELMGFALLWVMCFHAFDLDLGSPGLEFLRSCGFGGVDIFILLSSMGLTMSLLRHEQTYDTFMRRRVERILPAYYTVVMPYTVFTILRDGVPWIALLWNGTLMYYWVRCKGAFNWYVAGAMTFYLLTPPVFRRLRDTKHRELWTAASVALTLLLCQWLMHAGYWAYLDVFYRIAPFTIGILLGLYVSEERPLAARSAAVWTVSLALGLGYLWLWRSDVDTAPVVLQLCHVFAFTTVPLCLALCLLFEKLPLGAPCAFLRLVGRNSLEIYLLNASFFTRVQDIRRYVHFGPTNRLYYLIAFSLNIALGILLHRALEAVSGKLRRKHKGDSVT